MKRKLEVNGETVETWRLWTFFEWPDEFDAAVTSFGMATLSVRRPHNGDPFQVRFALKDDESHEIPWTIKGAILHPDLVADIEAIRTAMEIAR